MWSRAQRQGVGELCTNEEHAESGSRALRFMFLASLLNSCEAISKLLSFSKLQFLLLQNGKIMAGFCVMLKYANNLIGKRITL